MGNVIASGWERLLAIAERRLPALTRLKNSERLPITLTRQRIYVVPTQFGVFFGVFLAVMTLGALNYNNNPALILCFLLASVAHSGLLLGFLVMRGVRFAAVGGAPVHAGTPLPLRLRFDAADRRQRNGLVLRRGESVVSFNVNPGVAADVSLPIPTEHRGWLKIGRIELSMRRPLGMFVCWSWLHPDDQVLVYPALEANAPPFPIAGDDGQMRRLRGPDEDVHGLRDYRAGDPLRAIAWKRSAQHGHTLVKEFESPAGRDAVLDWSQLADLPYEQRISRLARWLVEAERQDCRSELRLPGQTIGPARGQAHLHAGLRALALFNPPESEASAREQPSRA